jgi:hypothetical protein
MGHVILTMVLRPCALEWEKGGEQRRKQPQQHLAFYSVGAGDVHLTRCAEVITDKTSHHCDGGKSGAEASRLFWPFN